ncbi:hypothetical protein F5X99DRAFT_412671 [Biscogniauxia marginata]|nr:hypothetical protein F5X99DRAFT_412671 [Biscogniauxia marginata]
MSRDRHPPKPSDGGEMVTIQIPCESKFYVHANLLVHYSRYFKAALGAPMEEAKSMHFNLEEHASNNIMSIYIDWIYERGYTRQIPFRIKKLSAHELIAAWLLGDYLQTPKFQNDIMKHLYAAGSKNTSSDDMANAAVQHLGKGWVPAQCQMHKFLIDVLIRYISTPGVVEKTRVEALKHLNLDEVCAIGINFADRLARVKNEADRSWLTDVVENLFSFSGNFLVDEQF